MSTAAAPARSSAPAIRLPRVRADERTDVGVGVPARTDPQARGGGHKGLADLVLAGAIADQHSDRAREASLAGGSERRSHDRGDGCLEVGVGHHHQGVLGAAERLATLAGGRRALGDVAGGRRLPDERDRVHLRVVQQPVDRIVRAVHQVADARRDLVDSVDELEDPLRGPRVALRRLEDEGVAARDREGEEPEGDHGREVERRDRADDPHRLADEVHVNAAGDPLEPLALEKVGDAAGCLGRLDSPQHLAARVVEGLSHVLRDEGGDLVTVAPRAPREAPSPPGPGAAAATARHSG